MQARAATSKAARPNRIQQARFDAYGNQWLAIAGVCSIPNVLNKNQIFVVKSSATEGSAERFLKGKTSILGSFVREIGVLETGFPKMVILRRRNGRPETEGIKNEHLASTKRSFVICILAQQPGLVGWAQLQIMVK